MTEQDIIYNININKKKLTECENKIAELQEKYDTLEEFEEKCNKEIERFDENIIKRKCRLHLLESTASKIKIFKSYLEVMDNMLTGDEYKNTVNAINDLMDSIEFNKRMVNNDIMDVKAEIRALRSKIEILQSEYNKI